MISGKIFEELLTLNERSAWEAFKSRVPDYEECIEKPLQDLTGYEMANVTQDSFSPLPPEFLLSDSSEWRTWRKVSRYY